MGRSEGNTIGKVAFFKAEIREPYMGNMVPLRVRVRVWKDGSIDVQLTNPEGITRMAEREQD